MNGSNDLHLKIRGAVWRHYETARLQISVGQAYHEGIELAETVSWVGANFKNSILCVNDTLQRYNIPGSQEAGDAWLARNAHIIAVLPSVKIFRWDHWLNHPDFPDLHASVRQQYRNDPLFKKAVDEEAMSFVARRAPSRMGAAMESSVSYLLEECAAFQIMFRTPAADIYPGSTLLPCQVFKGDPGKGFTRVELRQSAFAKRMAG